MSLSVFYYAFTSVIGSVITLFVLLVTISSVSCRCLKAMLFVRILPLIYQFSFLQNRISLPKFSGIIWSLCISQFQLYPAHWCMSSQREVFIRILALLQRKTLIETKNRTLKCLKRHYSTVQSMKNVTVLTKDGAFALFFCPHPGGFNSSRVPTPREFAIQGEQNANARGSARGWGGAGQLDLTNAYQWYPGCTFY